MSAHQGLLGGPMITTVDATYLADAVILMRFFEMRGEIRQAVSVVKKRGGRHERTIREFTLEDGSDPGRQGAAPSSAACSPASRSTTPTGGPARRSHDD